MASKWTESEVERETRSYVDIFGLYPSSAGLFSFRTNVLTHLKLTSGSSTVRSEQSLDFLIIDLLLLEGPTAKLNPSSHFEEQSHIAMDLESRLCETSLLGWRCSDFSAALVSEPADCAMLRALLIL